MSGTELNLEVIENNLDLFKERIKDETTERLAYKCRALGYDCPISYDRCGCPFNLRCSEVSEVHWDDVEYIINSYD